MKKKPKKKVSLKLSNKKILVIITILAIIAFVTYFSYPFISKDLLKTDEFLESEVGMYSNVTELYSLFTVYMEESVNSYLKYIECQPNKYCYDDSSICFTCNEMEACFGYGWVNRSGGEKMNPVSPFFLKGKYSKEELISFHSYGMSWLLNCVCNENCTCNDEINVELTENDVRFTFPTNASIKQKIEEISGEGCNVAPSDGLSFIHCKNLRGIILNESNTLIIRYA